MRLISFLIILMLMPSFAFAESITILQPMMMGERLIVRLPSNPTTGFDWELVRMHDFLEQIGEREFVQGATASGMVGVGGVTIWRFQIVSSGTGMLGFAYRRSWETVPPIERVEYRLTVTP